MVTALTLLAVFLAGVIAGTYGHIIAAGPERRGRIARRRGAARPRAGIAVSSEQDPAVTDIAAALRNLGARPAAALSAARKVVADLPAAEFSERFRAALIELPTFGSPHDGSTANKGARRHEIQ